MGSGDLGVNNHGKPERPDNGRALQAWPGIWVMSSVGCSRGRGCASMAGTAAAIWRPSPELSRWRLHPKRNCARWAPPSVKIRGFRAARRRCRTPRRGRVCSPRDSHRPRSGRVHGVSGTPRPAAGQPCLPTSCWATAGTVGLRGSGEGSSGRHVEALPVSWHDCADSGSSSSPTSSSP